MANKRKGLVLTIRTDEEIWINLGEIKIVLMERSGSYVRLLFSAPKHIKIDRLSRLLEDIGTGEFAPTQLVGYSE